MKVRSTENLIKSAWKLYKKNLSNFIITGLIFFALIFLFAFLIILSFFILPIILAILVSEGSKIVLVSLIITLIFTTVLIFLLFVSYQDVIFILIAQEAFSGKSALPLSLVFKKGLKKLWSYFWVNCLISLIIFLGLVCFIVPGIVLALYLFFVKYLIIADNTRGLKNLKLSIKLTKSYLGEIFILSLLFIVASFIANSFAGAGLLTTLLVYPMMICASFLLYTDIKKDKKLSLT